MSADGQARPVRVALRNDYEIVLGGFRRMLERYQHRVEVVEVLEQQRIDQPVDVALYDTFAQHEPEHHVVAEMIANPANASVAVYSWIVEQELIDAALRQGVRGYFAKSMTALELVEAIERVAAGEVVCSPPDGRVRSNAALDWPGRADGLSDRESEVLALITQGKSNAEVAARTHLAPNTIKTHIRSAYRKIGATNRVEAVLWGVQNGFRPDHDAAPH
ncbi:helix-turn-helix transcriptional regulator [Amnibacterium kyonggiense]|uniref:helix-turn-helix transcriptional regulator n=1 Tax=Amnibacterium kyonggiense TaxID=595671 RepID=UPI001FE88115|nr:response regulator transcription factor [Amnibacterium kyonggiense]